MSELCYLPAAELLRLFRARALPPVELVTAVIERAEAVEPAINAFAETFYSGALAMARAAESRYAGHGAAPRPLEGLPVAVKEEAGTYDDVTVFRRAAAHEERFPWLDTAERRPVL